MGLSMANRYTAADLLPAAWVVLIGIAEVAHLIGVFFGCSFQLCCLLQGIAVILVLTLAVVCFIWKRQRSKRKAIPGGVISERERANGSLAGSLLLVLFLLVAATQIAFVLWNPAVYRQGDMTVETVGSFLQNDGIYRVNPLTGQAYQQGIPSRIKILCLPTLYGGLSTFLPYEIIFAMSRKWCGGRCRFWCCLAAMAHMRRWEKVFSEKMKKGEEAFFLQYCWCSGQVAICMEWTALECCTPDGVV